MGFFVAGFVRLSADDGDFTDPQGPYERDTEGRIVRDVLGMPVLKSTGLAVSLEQSEPDVEGRDQPEDAKVSSDGNGDSDNHHEDDEDTSDDDEWTGFAD